MVYYYKTIKDKLGFIYSLDNIRLNFLSNDIKDFMSFISSLFNFDFNYKYYYNNRGVGYTHLWVINVDKFSFSIGLSLNMSKDKKNEGFIEFNPNKLMNCNKFIFFYDNFLNYVSYVELIRFDLAIDIPLKREYIRFNNSGRFKYTKLVYNNCLTEYLGTHNNHNFTKLYDKTKESNLNYNLTRYEITLNNKDLKDNNFPSLSIIHNNITNNFDFSSLSSTQLVLIDLLRNTDNYILYSKLLSRNILNKIKPYLQDYIFTPDYLIILQIKEIALSFTYNKHSKT